MKKSIFTFLNSALFVALLPVCVSAQKPVNTKDSLLISDQFASGDFPLVYKNKASTIYYDNKDALVVAKVASAFQNDVKLVTGIVPGVKTGQRNLSTYPVIIGTLGQSALIDQLQKANKIDVSKVEGKWETFGIAVVDHPFPKVKQALVIYGSDRRGTAYGAFEVSKLIGVSPFGWWADVVPTHKNNLFISPGVTITGPPTVKYRGIFINDEDWGMHPWASKTYDPQLGDIGPKTYAKIYELLLRLRANCIWPAMHPVSGAFNKYPANKLVADSFAIVTGSSHPEPLLFNNASEWNVKTMGPWNYDTNKKGILKVLSERVKGNAPFESVYTIALRGIHDAGMVSNLPVSGKVKLLDSALQDERDILAKNISKPLEDIPQIFIPYKEVMDLYESGLKVPDDVTLVWPDDNFGYVKRLSNPEEQKRSGHSGVYYHVSYLGEPHDNLWFSSTPPALMYEELSKVYETGGDRFWILNVGDLKGSEYSMKLFLDMAWDIHRFSFENINKDEPNWLASIFGEKYQDDFTKICDQYYHLAFSHKPEYMGGGLEWNNNNNNEKIVDTKYSFVNYNEAQSRIDDYDALAEVSAEIYNSIDPKLKPAYFELLHYPVKGSDLLNKQMLLAKENRIDAVRKYSVTNLLQQQVQSLHDSLAELTDQYNSLLNGKWNHMMSLKSGITSRFYEMPPTEKVLPAPNSQMALSTEGEDFVESLTDIHTLPGFNSVTKKTYFIDVYNKGNENLDWEAKPQEDWISLSKTSGNTQYKDRIWVSVNWSKIPKGESATGEIIFIASDKKESVIVNSFNPTVNTDSLKNYFVEDNGVVSIDAADYSDKTEDSDIKIESIKGIGIDDASLKLGDVTNKTQDYHNVSRPHVTYNFYTFQRGNVDVYTYALPVFSLDDKHETRYGVGIDNGITTNAIAGSKEYMQSWKDNVLRNFSVYKSSLYIDKPGKHTLEIYCTDPGMVVEKIIIDLGGLKQSFLGPTSEKIK
ncbi:MAG: glycosyl hydrolase 115 family protein [Ginsengibacter sp.]